jgi:hypothetical protein
VEKNYQKTDFDIEPFSKFKKSTFLAAGTSLMKTISSLIY